MSEKETANDFTGKAIEKPEDRPPSACTQVTDKHNTPDVTKASQTSESVPTEESKNQSSKPCESEKETHGKAEVPSSSSSMLSKPVTFTVPSASVLPTQKVIVSTTAVKSATPLVVGARVVSAASMAAGVQNSNPGGGTVISSQVRGTAMTQAPLRGAIITVPRAPTQQQNVAVVRTPQTTSLQLPANFQIPQGMVLIRSDSGQLILVSQQALAQAQAQGVVSKPSTTVRLQASQTTATATSLIRVSLPPSSATVATIIKPASTTETTILKPNSSTSTATVNISSTTGSAIIKSPKMIGTSGLKPSSTTGSTVIKATAVLKPSIGTINCKGIGTNVTTASVVKSSGKTSSLLTQTIRPVGSGPTMMSPNIPTKVSTSKTSTPFITSGIMENVKKCKNFLITLMKLASSGTRSADMAQNVQALVKDLLDGRLEAEEFTEKLYMELKSSPQPYLVPFLKRSLPALRQLTPNSQLFIEECEQPKAFSSSMVSTPKLSSTNTISQPLQGSVTPRPTHLVIQQPKAVIVGQRMTTLSQVALPVQNRPQPKQPVVQSNTQAAGCRQNFLQKSKDLSRPAQATHAHNLKNSISGSYRDDDDINDVASMAGVNVNEENAKILASNSELVGTVVHSCRDEPFLPTAALQQRVLHMGHSLGVVEVSPEVLVLLSHATQERLRDLLEKLTAVAQQHNVFFGEDSCHIQINDTRSQLKFLEQLEKIERQKREEEERETLLRIAKSRCNSEDPEQLRLKQRAKEMQQLELAQMEHREANLAALAALGPRKRKLLEASGPGTNQVRGLSAQRTASRAPTRVTFRHLIFCMEQDRTLRCSRMLYKAFLH